MDSDFLDGNFPSILEQLLPAPPGGLVVVSVARAVILLAKQGSENYQDTVSSVTALRCICEKNPAAMAFSILSRIGSPSRV